MVCQENRLPDFAGPPALGKHSFDSPLLSVQPFAMKSLLLVLLLLAPQLVFSEEKEAAVSTEILRKALDWMKSEDPARRQAAYSTMQLLDRAALPKFQTALFAAKAHHEKQLGRVLSGSLARDYLALEEDLQKLKEERARVYPLLKTDYKKDAGEIKKLQNEVRDIARIHERAMRLSQKDLSALNAKVEATADAIVEISTELVRIESHREGEPFEPNEEAPERLRKDALEESYDGERYLKFKQGRNALSQEITNLELAREHNVQSAWASSSQKDFAHILNEERGVMGLGPLYLEEKLSAASSDHSQDMKKLGFFAHESPVEGKKTPGQRAKLAGFAGRWTGENIFMGSGSPSAAYDAWFYSDGHRFIMFAQGPNQLGIGPIGAHWTMMTGQK